MKDAATVIAPAAGKRSLIRRIPVGWLLVLPAAAWVGAFLLLPLVEMLRTSFLRHEPGGGIAREYTTENYERFLSSDVYHDVLWQTLVVGVTVTVLCLVLGYPVALAITRAQGRKKSLLYALTVLPLVTGVVVRTFGWYVILGREGVVNELLVAIGVIDGPKKLLFTPVATIIALTEVLLPFMILALQASIEAIHPWLRDAARSLGANEFTTFLRVTLPLSRPGITTGVLVVFVLAVSSYVTPALVGGVTSPVIAQSLQEQAVTLLNWPLAAAMSFSLLVVLVVAVYLFLRVMATGPAFRTGMARGGKGK